MALGFKKTVLSGDEYCGIFADLILEYYRRIISDDKIFVPLKISKQKEIEFSIELSLLLFVIAMRIYELENPRKIIVDYVKGKVSDSICEKLFKGNFENENEYLDAFNAKYKMFEELTPIKDKKLNIDGQLLGMSRYFVSEFTSEKQEEKNKNVIIALNEQLNEFSVIIHKLSRNSMLKKTSALIGKYEFVVLQ